MKSLKKDILKGVKWSFVDRVCNQGLKVLVLITLARILSPDDFGLFAMITVFSSFAMVLRNAGFGQALIFKKNTLKKDYDTVFTINFFLGLFFSLVFYFGAHLIADFYKKPLLNELTKVVSFVFLIQSISGVSTIELKKSLNFKKIAIINNLSFLFSSSLAIVLAYMGYGVWSLVWKFLLENILITTLTLLMTKYRCSFKFSNESFKELWKYSLSVTSNQVLTYWMRSTDNLMIGKFINQKALGEYNMAYQIMLFPIQNVSRVIAQVLFPALSKIKGDIDKIRSIYLKIVQTIALIIFPIMILIILLPKLFVLTVLGVKWIGISSFLPLLALVSMPQSIFTISGSVYLSIGKPEIPLKINLISFPFYILGFYFGLKYEGILGLIKVYVIINMITFIPIYYYLAKSINLSLSKYFMNLYPVFFSSSMLIFAVYLVKKSALIFNIKDGFYLTSLFLTLALLFYALSIFFYRKKIFILSSFKKKKNNR